MKLHNFQVGTPKVLRRGHPPGAAPTTPHSVFVRINPRTINAPFHSVQYKFLIATIKKSSAQIAGKRP